jgi:hypothetical protein
MIRRIGLGLVVTAMVTMATLSAGMMAGPAGAAPAPAGGSSSTHLSGNSPSGVRAAARHVHPAVAGSGQHAVVPGPWSIASLPTVSTDDWLNGDSCATSSFCVAVGGTNPGSTDQTLIEQWDGAAWSVVPSPNSSTTADDSLSGVSCVTTSFCVAVGYNDDNVGDNDQTLIEEWNGTAWSIVSSPNTSPNDENDLYSVSCSSTTYCEAAGEVYSSVEKTLVLGWNGSTWTIQTTPDPSSTDSYFNAVTCRSASWCIGVGAAQSGGHSDTAVYQWNGTVWSVLPSPTPTAGAYLDGVSCPSTTFCAAVGYTAYSGPDTNTSPVIEQWNGTFWTIVPSPAAAGSFGDELWAVSCVGPTSCTTVGYNYTDSSQDTYVTEALVFNGTSWTQQPPANPAVDNPGENYAELYGVSCVGGQSCVAAGDAYPGNGDNDQALVETASIARPGYRFVAGDGGVFAFGGASFNGSAGGTHLNKPVVGMAATPDGGGYWLVASDGGVFSYGDAAFYGSTGSLTLNKPIVGIASTPDGAGYWLVASDGGIFAFGDATFYGSTGSLTLNKPVVGMAASPSGHGYWLVASDGGIFSFGDATFHGSTGSLTLNKPVVGMASTPSGNGYWLVASDGGIFAFDAGFHGSAGSLTLNKPVVGMASTPSGNGYWLVASDGGVFSYGDAVFSGSTGSLTLNSPIVGMSA